MKTYPINETFLSIQGEGARAGSLNVFVRFSACNQTCREETHGFDCDTEFTSSVMFTAEEIADRILELWPTTSETNIILTGGEPLLHVDNELLDALEGADPQCIAIETNGSLPLPTHAIGASTCKGAQLHVACSPKVAEHAIRLEWCNELRYVRHAGQGIPKPRLQAKHLFLSPAWTPSSGVDPGALETCLNLVKTHPEWRLSMQTHKLLRIR